MFCLSFSVYKNQSDTSKELEIKECSKTKLIPKHADHSNHQMKVIQ